MENDGNREYVEKEHADKGQNVISFDNLASELTMFQKYERLPKTVEAVQFTDANKDRVFNLLTGQYVADFEDGRPIIKVTTIHGEIAIVRLGDWIIKEPKFGCYYPIKDNIFRDGYV